MKHKKLFITFVVLFTVALAIIIFFVSWFWADSYPDLAYFNEEFSIPGLDDGAVPQGIANFKSDDEQYFFTSTYFSDGKTPSRVYVTSESRGYIGYVTLKDETGDYFYGHCGGIAVSTDGKFVWITSEQTVYVIGGTDVANSIILAAEANGSADESDVNATSAETVGEIAFTDSFNSNLSEAAFVYYYDNPTYSSSSYDRLYIGEFYRKGNYETPEKHRLTTPSGDYNTALVLEYKYNSSNADFGLYKISSALTASVSGDNDVPLINAVYSITEKIQGFAIANGTLLLSQSYGPANSHILAYKWSDVTSSLNRAKLADVIGSNLNYEGAKTDNGTQITTGSVGLSTLYLYYIDSSVQTDDYDLPSMSEGLCNVDKKIYVLFESGCNKYKRVVRQRMDNVWSITL